MKFIIGPCGVLQSGGIFYCCGCTMPKSILKAAYRARFTKYLANSEKNAKKTSFGNVLGQNFALFGFPYI